MASLKYKNVGNIIARFYHLRSFKTLKLWKQLWKSWILHYELISTIPFVVDTPPSVSESLTLIQPNTEYRSCGNGQYLDITYGRYYCSNGSASVTDRMNTNCNYNSACTIQAQNNWLGGNPCVGITKTLEWTDACRGKSNRLKSYSCFYLII